MPPVTGALARGLAEGGHAYGVGAVGIGRVCPDLGDIGGDIGPLDQSADAVVAADELDSSRHLSFLQMHRVSAVARADVAMGLREEGERCCVGRADDAEVPPVQSGDVHRSEPLRDRDDDGVGCAERQVLILLNEVGSSCGVSGGNLHQFVQPVSDVAQEVGFCP